MAHRYFVTGTDTGVGKTQVSRALLSLLARTAPPFAFKPWESGVEDLKAPPDALALREAAGGHQPLETVSLFRFRRPLAPGLAAPPRPERWQQALRTFHSFGPGPGVVEGAGGLFVPVDAQHDVIDLLAALKLPAVLVARAGLGTLNHTRLSLEALSRRKLAVAAVVLVKSTPGVDPSESRNAPELRRRFPHVLVLGPAPFVEADGPRQKALRRVLAPLG